MNEYQIEVDGLATEFIDYLKKHPYGVVIDLQDFKENFIKIKQSTPINEKNHKHLIFLLMILRILPNIYKNRMEKISALLIQMEEDGINDIYKLNQNIDINYLKIAKKYLTDIKNKYNNVNILLFNDNINQYNPNIISNEIIYQFIQNIIYEKYTALRNI